MSGEAVPELFPAFDELVAEHAVLFPLLDGTGPHGAACALRQGLLSVKGIGPETADSILLYAMGRPLFVIDAYTHRILNRHGLLEEEATYEDMQSLFMDHLTDDSRLFNEFHALIVMTGKQYCKKRPTCSVCPLLEWGPTPPGR